mgnify:CR=1 FL=1
MNKNIFVFLILILSATVYAEKLNVKGSVSEELKQLQSESEQYRIKRETVNLMTVKNGPGKEVVTQKLIAKFKTGDTITTKTDENWEMNMKEDFTSVVGEGWDLTVFDDGTRVNYRNWKHVEENKEKYGKAKEMSLNELKIAGEKFIREELKDFVKFGAGEELVFLRSKYGISIIEKADGSYYDETLESNIAYFGRKKDGLMMVGNSSVIIVEFSNDRKPVSFYYRWKDYEESDEQIEIASREDIDYRISSLSSMNYGNVKNLEVKIVCGLYDDSEYVQPACEVQQSGEVDEGSFVGVINVIPAGRNYLMNDSWIELAMFDNYGEICRQSDITEEIFPEDEKTYEE